MPVSLIPRKEEKKRFKFQPDRIFWILSGTFLFLVLVFFGLKVYNIIQSSRLESIEKEIAKVDKEKNIELEKEIQNEVGKIDRIRPLLDSRQKAKNVFAFLEKNAYSEIKFSNFDFRSKERTVSLKGTAASSSVLIAQLSILKKSADLESIDISGISVSKEGIDFQLQLKLKPEVLK